VPDFGFLQSLMLPGMMQPEPDPMEQIIRAGSQQVMGSSPLAPAIEDIVRQAAERERRGTTMFGQDILPPGVTPEMVAAGRQNISSWLGPQMSSALGFGAQPEAARPIEEAGLGMPAPVSSPRAPMPAGGAGGGGLLAKLRAMAKGAPQSAEGLGGAYDKQAEAQKALGGAQSAAMSEQARILSQAEAADGALAVADARDKSRRDAAQQQVADRISAFEDATKKANSAQIDPDRWYRDSSGSKVGRHLGAGVAMALGAFGAAFTKGPNYAMQIINDAVDRDLMAQRADIASKREDAKDALTSVNIARQNFTDATAIGAAERAAELGKVGRMLEIAKLQSGSEEVKQRANLLGANVEVEKQKAMAAAQQSEFERSWNMERQLGAAQAQAAAGPRPAPRGLRVLDPARPPSKTDTETAQKKAALLSRALTALDRGLAKRKAMGAKVITPREAKVILQEMTQGVAAARGLKVKPDTKPEDILGFSDLGEIGYTQEAIQATKEGLRAQYESELSHFGYGLDDVQSVAGGWEKVR